MLGGGITYGAGQEARRQFLTATVLLIVAGCAVVLALVASADLKGPGRLVLTVDGPSHIGLQQTQKLWFSPGIQDQLNRQVRIGQAMSGRLRGLIDQGLDAQARMVHLDEFHDNEVKMAARCVLVRSCAYRWLQYRCAISIVQQCQGHRCSNSSGETRSPCRNLMLDRFRVLPAFRPLFCKTLFLCVTLWILHSDSLLLANEKLCRLPYSSSLAPARRPPHLPSLPTQGERHLGQDGGK